MKFTLSTLLEKLGVDTVQDLTPEEQVTFRNWQAKLTGEPVTVETIQMFCKNQVEVIQSKCDGVVPLTNVQQASLHVYLNILKAIEAPQAEREALERHLTQIINSP